MEINNGLGKVVFNNGCMMINLEEFCFKRKILCLVCEGDFVNIVCEDFSVEISVISDGKLSD